MSAWGVLAVGAVWVLSNLAVLYQLRPENTHARAQARNTYFIHRYGERLDVAEEESTERTLLLLRLVLTNGFLLAAVLAVLFFA